jgi:di/tricarboxylate transporter
VSTQLLVTLLVLLIAAILLISDRVRADLVALLVVVALGVSGVLTPREAFSGFSSSAVVTMAAIFVLVAGLQITGMTGHAGAWLQRLAGADERGLVIAVMVIGALLSLFMNNIAAAAILLPAVSGIASRTGARLSHLLMPLAFATLLGGMATLFTTTNLIASGILRTQNLPGFGVLDFLPVGGPMAVAGILFMTAWGLRLLPTHAGMDGARRSSEATDLVGVYRLGERLFRARIPAGSSLIGKPLAGSTLRETYGVTVVALERQSQVIPVTSPDTSVVEGDVVVLEGNLDEFRKRDVEPYLEILPAREWREGDLETDTTVIIEAVLAPRSGLLGQTLRTARFREKYGMAVLGVWRQGRPIRTNLGDRPLQFGDALLLQGASTNLALLRTEPDLILLVGEQDAQAAVMQPGKGPVAVAIMAVTLVAATLTPTLVGEIMLAGALAMVVAGLLTMDQVYGAIEWRSIFLVAGLVPLGLAMTSSGAAALLADQLVARLNPIGPAALLAGVVLLTAVLTQLINGAAVVGVVAPIAIEVAQGSGLDPRALVMGVALASSLAFVTPLGHAVNVLVMGPAGYRLGDFSRVGLPLTVLLLVVLVLLLPVFWPLVPR